VLAILQMRQCVLELEEGRNCHALSQHLLAPMKVVDGSSPLGIGWASTIACCGHVVRDSARSDEGKRPSPPAGNRAVGTASWNQIDSSASRA
jgi:hypothetical protein